MCTIDSDKWIARSTISVSMTNNLKFASEQDPVLDSTKNKSKIKKVFGCYLMAIFYPVSAQ